MTHKAGDCLLFISLLTILIQYLTSQCWVIGSDKKSKESQQHSSSWLSINPQHPTFKNLPSTLSGLRARTSWTVEGTVAHTSISPSWPQESEHRNTVQLLSPQGCLSYQMVPFGLSWCLRSVGPMMAHQSKLIVLPNFLLYRCFLAVGRDMETHSNLSLLLPMCVTLYLCQL